MHRVLLLSFAVVFVVALGSPYEKKADISALTSAINGAGRLRYGKRSNWADEGEDTGAFAYVVPESDEPDRLPLKPFYGDFVKRTPKSTKLIESLNGAQRLRFGRK